MKNTSLRDRSGHINHIERLVLFVRENSPQRKKIHAEFINALSQKKEQILQQLLLRPGGKEKIRELYQIQPKVDFK